MIKNIDNSELEKAIVRLDEVYNALCEISVRKNKKHYQNVMKMYPQFMRNMYSWYLYVYNAKKAVAEGEIPRARGLLTSAVYYAESVMALIKNASYDKWANWYRGDNKIGINNIIVKTRTVLEQIKKC